MKCTACGAENKNRAKFCESCGAKIEKAGKQVTCGGCGKTVSTKYQFCPFCGTDIWEGKNVQKPKSAAKKVSTGAKVVIALSVLIAAVITLIVFALFNYAANRIEIDEARERAQAAMENSAAEATQAPKATAAPAKEESEETSEAQDAYFEFLESGYPDGVYEVGVDIPEGIYLLAFNDPDTHQLCKFANAPSRDLLDEYSYTHMFGYSDFVYIADGDLIKTTLCTAIPYDELDWMFEADVFLSDEGYYDQGGYIVGDAIPAGTYEVASLNPASDTNHYIQVWDSIEQRRLELRHEVSPSIDNAHYVSGEETITVTLEEGQYIFCSVVGLTPKNLAIMRPIFAIDLF